MGQKKAHADVLIGVRRAVRPADVTAGVLMPIHDVIAVGIRNVLLRIGPDPVEQGLVGHHGGDEETVTDAFRDRVVAVGVPIDAIAGCAGTPTGTGRPCRDDGVVVPSRVHGRDIGLERRGCFLVGLDAIGIRGVLGEGIGGTARINGGGRDGQA